MRTPPRANAWQLMMIALAWLSCRSGAAAQATFFQVPSGDVPDAADVSGQLQANISKVANFGTLLVVGLGRQFEVGLTAYSLGVTVGQGQLLFEHNALDRSEPLSPILLATTQKRFELSEFVDFSAGLQLGGNLAERRHMTVAARGYVLLLIDIHKDLRCSVGPYAATHSLLGDGQPFGAFLGCDAEFGLFGFEVDWDTGAHALGAFALGPRLHLGEHVAISVGAQLPNPWSSASYGGLAQLEVAYPGREE